jgi:hypothetical protein
MQSTSVDYCPCFVCKDGFLLHGDLSRGYTLFSVIVLGVKLPVIGALF